jgi:hypothetical protein
MTALSRVVRGARVRRRDGQQLGGEGSAGAAMTPLNTEVVSRAPGLLVQRQTARFGPIGMEQLWNRGGATGGKSSGRQKPENRLNWRQTVADGCHRLPFGSHGKEGVDGSSPSEGSAKHRLFCRRRLQDLQYAVRVEPFMEPSGSERTIQSVRTGCIRRRRRHIRSVNRSHAANLRVGNGLDPLVDPLR